MSAGSRWAWVAAAVLLSVVLAARGWAAVTPCDPVPIDGPFQLFNALRRLDAGQHPGRDFPAFHGVGLPVLHYPVYKLLGGDFLASELARQWVTAAAHVVAYLLLGVLLFRDFRPGVGLLAFDAVLLPAFTVACGWNPGNWLEPGGSLQGLRGLAPLLAVGLLIADRSGRWATVALAILLGLSPVLGIEQGLALGAAFAGTWVLAGAVGRFRGRPARRVLVAALGGAVIAAALTLMICTPAGVGSWAKFAFGEVPADQMWYFGTPPARHFGSGQDGQPVRDLVTALLALAAVAAWVIGFRGLRHATDADRGFRFGLTVGAGYAALALASCLSQGYEYNWNPSLRVLLVCAAAAWWRSRLVAQASGLCEKNTGQRPVPPVPIPARVAGYVSLAGLALLAVVTTYRAASYGPPRVADEPAAAAERFAERIRRSGDGGPYPVWSTYTGLLEARLGVLSPAEDYIIHALGPDRRTRYTERFVELRPPFVVTLRPSIIWEEWLRDTIWPFYDELLRNYTIVDGSASHLLWQRNPGPRVEAPTALQDVPTVEGGVVVSPRPSAYPDQVAVVRVEYRVENAAGRVPVVGSLPRYFLDPIGARSVMPVSLPPYRTVWEFPIVVEPGKEFALRFRTTRGVAPARFVVSRVSVRYTDVPAANAAFLPR